MLGNVYNFSSEIKVALNSVLENLNCMGRIFIFFKRVAFSSSRNCVIAENF